MRLLALLPTAILASAVSSGCFIAIDHDHDDTGDLTLFYRFGGQRCDSASVDTIDVTLRGVRFSDSYHRTVTCQGFARGISISNLIDDDYDVTIEGRALDGTVLFRTDTQQVAVIAFTEQSYDIEVPSVTGDLSIFWTFAGSGACGSVVEVRVTLVDPNGVEFDDSNYDCATEGVVYDAVVGGRWTVTLRGIDAMDRIVYRANDRPLDLRTAAHNEFSVDLSVVP